MKKILFAMAVIAALASCQKADLAEQNSVNTNGERVITAYFDNAGTKTTLDGVTPKWSENDKIMLLNGLTHDEITLEESNISADGKSITFTTSLEGPLYAVYPSTAAGAENIETDDNVPVTLSAEDQDGTFASANICVAKENDGSLAFKNVTSVLHLTQNAATTKVNEIIITTPSAYIAGTGTVDMSATTPALTLDSGQSKIKVKSASVKSDYYIAVAPTTLPEGTAFGFATGSQLGGTNLSEGKTIEANTIYDIGSMDLDAITPNTYHDYVEIEMTVNSVTKKYKWATMNIGASSATDAGHYFAWGYAEGCVRNTAGDGWVLASDNTTEKQFNTTYFENRDASSFKDAATANWGGSWRMPTGGTDAGDFIGLFRACGIASGYQYTPTPDGGTGTKNKGVYWCEDYSGKKGALFIAEDNGPHLFFPAAGLGKDTSKQENNTNHLGFYLSSTSAAPAYAFCLYIGKDTDKVEIGANQKYFGWSVRPVSD